MQKQKNNKVIDTMHSSEMKAALQKSLDVIAKWSKKKKKLQHAINKKMAHQCNLDTPHQIFIAPAHRWDLIVNTSLDSPENIAHQIAEFIEKRSRHF